MKLSAFKEVLKTKDSISIVLPNGQKIPPHFHVTEVGQIDKTFIDCGGTLRRERTVNFQLWEADDYDHRLHPEKLLSIIELSESKLGISDEEIEVEYQAETIGKFGLEHINGDFHLMSLTTDCLAKDKCGVPTDKIKAHTGNPLVNQTQSCTPGSGCC